MTGSQTSLATIHIRPATLDDIRTILHHRRSMYEDMGKRDTRALDIMEVTSEKYFRSAIVDGSYRGFLAETSDRKVVAGGGIVISHWPAHPGGLHPRRAMILNMYTEKEFRRRGIARQLMLVMMDWVRREGFPKVGLHASDEGRPLYESLGFEVSNEMEIRL
ncbi:MAG TPA: GNAT family N-acetyltransferase [Terriglobales bacterium]|jgi:GNAT superfamily N-acetyltransferase|nr:GNAT family N-acetyltransferase [Terriglobales bacterium]